MSFDGANTICSQTVCVIIKHENSQFSLSFFISCILDPGPETFLLLAQLDKLESISMDNVMWLYREMCVCLCNR